MVSRLKQLLGRPASDTFYSDPAEYYAALNEVVRATRSVLSSHYPGLLYTESAAVPTSDDGTTYPIPDSGEILGRMRVYEPPGIRTGLELIPAMPGSMRSGFRIVGSDIKLTIPGRYTPGLYFLYVSTDFTEIDGSNDSPLPNFMDDYIVYKAAAVMARKAGSGIDPATMEDHAYSLWTGDKRNVMDTGIIGLLTHYADRSGLEGLDFSDDRWWSGIR